MNKIDQIQQHLNQAKSLIWELEMELSLHKKTVSQPMDFQAETDKKEDMLVVVTRILREIGVPPNTYGYKYLRDSILKLLKEPEVINQVTKVLYVDVARMHNTTPSRVERAMRHAIETAWARGDIEKIESLIGFTSNKCDKPTNSEFLAVVSENLLLNHKVLVQH